MIMCDSQDVGMKWLQVQDWPKSVSESSATVPTTKATVLVSNPVRLGLLGLIQSPRCCKPFPPFNKVAWCRCLLQLQMLVVVLFGSKVIHAQSRPKLWLLVGVFLTWVQSWYKPLLIR